MIKCVILDLDMTMVDSSCASAARNNRNWGLVYSLIPKFSLYEGVRDFISDAKRRGLSICVVSTSPAVYVRRVLNHFCLPVDHVIGFHDAKPIKPHPAPMLKALEYSGCEPSEAISFGDRDVDMLSSNKAGIKSIGCMWGSNDPDRLKSSASVVIDSPYQMRCFLT